MTWISLNCQRVVTGIWIELITRSKNNWEPRVRVNWKRRKILARLLVTKFSSTYCSRQRSQWLRVVDFEGSSNSCCNNKNLRSRSLYCLRCSLCYHCCCYSHSIPSCFHSCLAGLTLENSLSFYWSIQGDGVPLTHPLTSSTILSMRRRRWRGWCHCKRRRCRDCVRKLYAFDLLLSYCYLSDCYCC